MGIPESYRNDAAALPPVLRALLDAELAVGNEIVEVGHSFPAPPAGAYFKLARPVTTRLRAPGDGLDFRDFASSIYSGEFTDTARRYFIIEAPLPLPPEPDMDAIRAARYPGMDRVPAAKSASAPGTIDSPLADSPRRRFERSMVIDYEKWHDGIGYELDALAAMSPSEREAIETLLAHKQPRDWRDIEALAALDTPRARKALQAAMRDNDPEVRAAVISHAPHLVPDGERTRSTVRSLETAAIYGGLSQTLDQVEDFHPPEVIDALFRGALNREGDVACHFAAMLYYLHDKAPEPFDWEQRPFFLRFNTEDRTERAKAFAELCSTIGVDARKYRHE